MASLKDLIVMGPARFLDKLYGNLEGNATSADKLKTARSINGTNFDGTTAITTNNWGTARTVIISDNSGTNTQSNSGINGSANFTLKLPATIKASLSGNASTATTATYALKMQTYKYNSTETYGTSYPLYAQWNQQGNILLLKCDNYIVNTDSATKLATPRAINGTNFDGSAAITTANWGTARTLTIGNTGKSVNGSGNVSWSLAEIGAVPKIEGNANVAYPVYRALGNIYKGGAAVSYYRIALPQATSWGMFMMKLAVRESYSTGSAGEIIIYANHSSSADWNQFFATCVGNLSTNIKVYGSDKKYFYIGGSFSYGGLSIELMTVGDTASTINLSNVVIDTVTALPSTYQTATMCYSLHSNNYTTHLDSRYVTLATEQTITAAKTLTSNWSFKTTNYTSTPIQLLDDSTTYGHTMLIGAGGTTYIGAGESASTLYSKLAVKSTEDLILGADSSIRFHTGADSATTTSGITLNTSNQLYPQTNNAGSLGTSSYKWGSIYSNKGYFGGTSTTDYALNTASFICDSWIRTKGDTGWYNETYSGGWYMSDTTYIRAYNSKKVYVSNGSMNAIYTAGAMRAAKGFTADESMSVFPGNNNEINFGGSNNSSTIYFGYRALDSKPIPTKFVFGSSGGTANLQCNTVYLGSGTSSYVSSTQYTGNAASASWLNTNSALVYGSSGLQYFNLSGTAGTNPKTNNTPTSDWHHILRMNHSNNSGYFADIAVPLNNTNGIYWRQIRNGTNYGWYTLLDSNNYTSYTVKKNGTGASGTWGINVTGYSKSLLYPSQLTTDALIDAFNTANTFQVTTWNSTSTPGVSNGILISTGWTSASYGAQIAIDDDPTYYIALRQRDGNGWKAWKRIPMGDGTGASGTWRISVTGSSASCTGNAATASQIAVTDTTPTTGTTYFPLYVSGRSGNQTVRVNQHFYYYDTGSESYICVGNTNQLGGVTLRQTNGYYTSIIPATLTAIRAVYLPDVTGTVLTTGNYPALTSCTGILTVAKGGTGATNKSNARINLGISSGTSLPSSGSAGDIFFLYA